MTALPEAVEQPRPSGGRSDPMNKNLLSALRETPGCGQDPDCTWPHDRAVEQANECDPCLTRLAEAVIEQVVARWPLDEVMMLRSYKPDIDTYEDVRRDVLASLLTALRSETPR